MRDLLYNQINPIVRIEESRLLGSALFSKMLASQSFIEVKALLQGTPYAEFIEASDFDTKFDYYLRKEQARLLKKMYNLGPEKEVIEIYSLRYTYHNVKLLTKAAYSNQPLDQYFLDDGVYSLATIKSAIKNRRSSSVKGLLMESIVEVHDYLDNYDNLRAIDLIYDRYYLKQQRAVADQLNYPDLTKEVIAFIDLTNISMVARGIRQGRNENFLLAGLSSSGSFSKRHLATFASKPLADFIDFLMASDYKGVVAPLIDSETQEINLQLLARERDNFLTKLYSTAHTQAFGPLPLLALLNAKDIEIRNIQLLLVGKKNHFSEEVIGERMRELDGL
ncbi:V-type ATPase subunit [uncultured Vagococcus sp.]|uniref:V-type ATPase subunit n=1 Tax=uncultured Vagococcus sp. TaxID=189676 RepID=UPI0028D7F22C|nr:V-type ATPase subunit [uncultured Vagococcus sp.]